MISITIISKYKDLEVAVSRMWKARTKTVPVIIGALGTVKKGPGQNLQALTGHRSTTELQKVAQMSTAHSICKVLLYWPDLFLGSGLTRRPPTIK